MRTSIACGRERIELEVPEDRLLVGHRAPLAPPLADPAAAVRAALEQPFGFPPLRRALTPDDRVAVVVDEKLPHLAQLLTAVLDHIGQAGVSPTAVTLVCPPPATQQAWIDDLPDAWQDAHVEVHDPSDRKRLAYLATTRKGRRVYLNRTVVDADQVVILTGRGYGTLMGYSGGEELLFPILSDEATRLEMTAPPALDADPAAATALRGEAAEVAWLLGVPFFVQLIPGADDAVCGVVTGPVESSAEGQRLLDARWQVTVDELADTVVVSLTGDPGQHDIHDLALALANAARVVQPEGRIVLLTQVTPTLGPGMELLRQLDNPDEALAALASQKPEDLETAIFWASSARRAHVYLLSGLPEDVVEELFAVHLEQASQVQRLLGQGSCLFIEDAHRSHLVLAGS